MSQNLGQPEELFEPEPSTDQSESADLAPDELDSVVAGAGSRPGWTSNHNQNVGQTLALPCGTPEAGRPAC
jgi:hypothetical protein